MPRRHHLLTGLIVAITLATVHSQSSEAASTSTDDRHEQFLRSKIREGNVEFEADTSKDTPGSDPIKNVLLDDSYMKPEWPGIEFPQMSTATWGYGARCVVRPEFARYLSAEWMLR